MNRTLGLVALAGLTVGVVCLSLAWAIGGSDFRAMVAEDRFGWRSCDDDVASGPERRLTWTGGDTVEVLTPVPVRLIAGDGDQVVMRGTPDAIAHLKLRGGKLISCGRRSAAGPVDIELPARALRHVRISGAGTVTLEKLSQRQLGLAISGSGDIVAQGTVDRLTATISGSANAHLADLTLKQLTVRISGSGNVEAAPKEAADIKLSGSGNVRLLSRPARLSSHVSGSGRISQMAETEGKK
jgi:hypothetical protein